ncbi:MAG: patatin-like phospholipase family protein [Synergistaceae bacterium]|jgi:NTE family protein|nr:patatin-like phospholipase family protein [Synergistaceae bacterium]
MKSHSDARHASIGLVLSGGGAKGAYQAGIVKALAEMDVPIAAISGASIGALNGAVTAASEFMPNAAERLEKLWRAIADDPPLGGKIPTSIRLLEAAGLRFSDDFRYTARLLREIAHNLLPTILSPDTGALVDNSRIRKLLFEYVSVEQLAKGLPLYVSVHNTNKKLLETAIGSGLARLRIKQNPEAEFLHIQSLSREDQHTALLASAAIPFLLSAQEIEGESYVDGGFGGVLTSQGNTPISPLLDAGYNPIIVTSLSDRSEWNKQKHPDAAIIEISREEKIDRASLLPEVFDIISFQPAKIYSWMEQGYRDAIRCIRPWLPFIGPR